MSTTREYSEARLPGPSLMGSCPTFTGCTNSAFSLPEAPDE